MTILISEQEVGELVSIEAAIPVVKEMFRMAGEGSTDNTGRLEIDADDGYFLVRAAALHAKKYLGFKLITSFGSGPRLMWNFLYRLDTGELVAIVQSHAITTLRTAAASAVAVKYLSPSTASVVGMYGAGHQAEAKLEAICRVRPITKVNVFSRNPQNRNAFCERMSARLSINVSPVASPELVPQDADIIVTMTRATETPVLYGDWIDRPALVVAVGANEWNKREIDHKVVERAAMIVVDDKEATKSYGGDLLWAESKGAFRWKQLVSLGDIVSGAVSAPTLGTDLILFESHGIALEDVAITVAAYERALLLGVGRGVTL